MSVARFAGQAQNHMGTDLQAALPAAANRIEKSVAVCPRSSQSRMRSWIALQAVFDGQTGPPAEFGQQVEHDIGNTIGPGADRQPQYMAGARWPLRRVRVTVLPGRVY